MIKKFKSPVLTPEQVIQAQEVHLSEAEKQEIEAEARSLVNANRKAELKRAYLQRMMRQLSGQVDIQHELDEETVQEYQIDLPGHSDRISLDGRIYLHGHVYEFNTHRLRSIKDIVSLAWRHEREIGGAYREHRKPIAPVLTPGNMNQFARF